MAITIQVKLFEYLSYGKPILAAQGSTAGDFVAEHDIGWTVRHDADAVATLLQRLRRKPSELAHKAVNVARILPRRRWRARAGQVHRELLALRPQRRGSAQNRRDRERQSGQG